MTGTAAGRTVDSNTALELARTRNCFCRVGAGGRALVFYTGDELKPGTWLEIGKTGMTDNGYVSSGAVDRLIGVGS